MENKTITKILIVLLGMLLAPSDPGGADFVRFTSCVGTPLTAEELAQFKGDWELLDEKGQVVEGPPLRITVGKGSSLETIEVPESPPEPAKRRRRPRKEPEPPVTVNPQIEEVRRVGSLLVFFGEARSDPKHPDLPNAHDICLVEIREGNLLRHSYPISKPFREEIEAGRLAGTALVNEKGDRAAVVITSPAEDVVKAFTPEFVKRAFRPLFPEKEYTFRRVDAAKP